MNVVKRRQPKFHVFSLLNFLLLIQGLNPRNKEEMKTGIQSENDEQLQLALTGSINILLSVMHVKHLFVCRQIFQLMIIKLAVVKGIPLFRYRITLVPLSKRVPVSSCLLSDRRSGRWRAILIAFGRAAETHSIYLIIIIMQMSDRYVEIFIFSKDRVFFDM